MAVRAKPQVYSVSAVNHHISSLFEGDSVLTHIYVRGELSNVKYASSGHLYFSLKDEKSQIRCAMWASSRRNLKVKLKDGDSIIAFGQISVYERDGTYQFYVTAVRPETGTGALYERYEELKKKLLEMGMFDASYKKPIPKYVRTLGVVTAQTGAAVRDIITVSRRRNPGIRIILYPARVQGDGAAASVAAGIGVLDRLGVCDVILIGRGGGSIEDLWAFNEEEVAYAIWNCETPVISAVGHETDTTIADFVADLRAPTPSAGAELAVADMSAVLLQLEEKRLRFLQLMKQQTDRADRILQQYALKMQLKGPEGRLRQSTQFLAQTSDRMFDRMDAVLKEMRGRLEREDLLVRNAIAGRLQREIHRYEILEGKLRALSPQAKLDAGYAYIEDSSRRGVSSVKGLKVGDLLTVRLRDGSVQTAVREIAAGEEGT